MIVNKFRKTINLLLIIIVFSLFANCTEDRPRADVSEIELSVKIKRFDTDLFSHQKKGLNPSDISSLRSRYPYFFDLFNNQIISVMSQNDTLLAGNLNRFINDSDIDSIYKMAKIGFSEIAKMEQELNEGFKHYKYYFPKKNIPEIITFISGFNYAVINADNILGIGLDMYLGNSCKYYLGLDFPLYKIARMRKEYIPADCLKSWALSEFEQSQEEQQSLLGEIIYNGKILYFTDAMLPETHDTLKIGYTKTQLEFCLKNESKIWAMFLNKKLLFSSNQRLYLRYVTDGPTTNGLPKNSPGMIGAWTGWRIVQSYMKNNPDVSLEMLMNTKNSNEILTKSKYKPEK